jgi:hypothetical protein
MSEKIIIREAERNHIHKCPECNEVFDCTKISCFRQKYELCHGCLKIIESVYSVGDLIYLFRDSDDPSMRVDKKLVAMLKIQGLTVRQLYDTYASVVESVSTYRDFDIKTMLL